MADAKRARPGPGHFALLNKEETQIDLLLSEAFLTSFVIVYKTKLNDRIEHNRLSHRLHYKLNLNHTYKQQ